MTATSMMRVSPETRERVMRIAAEYGGVTADEALRRLADEHWERTALAAMDAYRQADPDGHADYLREAVQLDATPGPALDPWDATA